MKATVSVESHTLVKVVPYERGDEPEGAVDLPPSLINLHQRASLALAEAEGAILRHLEETRQEWKQ